MVIRVLDFEPLRDFVTTVIHSIRSVAYAAIVVLVHFYIYAVLGTFLFRRASIADFGDLGRSCITLMHVNTGEGFSQVLTRLSGVDTMTGALGIAYFSSYVFVGIILLLGIVTAMITNDVWDHRNNRN